MSWPKHGRCYDLNLWHLWHLWHPQINRSTDLSIQETLPWSCCRRHRDSSAASPGSPPRWPRARLWGPVTRCWWRSLLDQVGRIINFEDRWFNPREYYQPAILLHLLVLDISKKNSHSVHSRCTLLLFLSQNVTIPPALNIEKDEWNTMRFINVPSLFLGWWNMVKPPHTFAKIPWTASQSNFHLAPPRYTTIPGQLNPAMLLVPSRSSQRR